MHDGLSVAAVADLLPLDLVDGGAGEEVHRPDSTHPLHRLDRGRRLSGLEAEQLGEAVLALLHQLERVGDDGRALLGRRRGPGTTVECGAGRGHGGVNVGRRRHRHLADVFAGGRTVHLDDFGGRRFGPFAADEKLVVFGLNVGHVRRSSSSLRSASSPAAMAPPYPSRSKTRTCSSRRFTVG